MNHTHRSWSWSGEVGGALGDLGITLPLAWALAAGAGFPLGRLLLVWGLAYLAVARWYRLPVSVQPLKAMAVIVLSLSLPPATVAAAAVLYGVVMLAIAGTGLIDRAARLFSPALVRGVQLGIGLMLLRKAVTLAWNRPLVLGHGTGAAATGLVLALAAALLLREGIQRLGPRIVLPLLGLGVLAGALVAGDRLPVAAAAVSGTGRPWLAWPDLSLWSTVLPLLIIPQLPLTLGNAVIAADDACHLLWSGRAGRVSPRRLAASIGVLDIACGLLGGFPVCHGAGGIAAHARFGARTWRAPVVIGTLLLAAGVVPGAAGLLLLVPVPLLAAMLALVAVDMIRLAWRLPTLREWLTAAVVGVTGLLTRNLTLAVLAGAALELTLRRGDRLAVPPPSIRKEPTP